MTGPSETCRQIACFLDRVNLGKLGKLNAPKIPIIKSNGVIIIREMIKFTGID